MYIPPKIHRFESTLLNVTDMTESVKEFTFSVPEGFIFVPGQFATMLFDANNKKYRRPYSIASTPQESVEKKQIRLCIKAVAGGPGTTYLWTKKIGDKINMMAPLGVFVIKDEHKNGPLTFVSTGTGVAPFASMISHLLANNFSHQITLLCGYRHETLYDDVFKTLQQKHANFNYIPTLTQPANKNYVWPGAKGRVHEHTLQIVNPTTHYYICGLYEMIEQTCRSLVAGGVKREQIHFERYD